MTRLRIAGLAVAALLGLSGEVHAQFGSYSRPQTSPYYRPAVSPYINLGVGRGGTATNYYGIVRPQQDAYGTFQRLQHEIDGPSPLFGSSLTDPHVLHAGGNPRDPQQLLPVGSITGHPVQFFNYGHYYSFKPRQGGGQ